MGEHRNNGYNTRGSILKAVSETGGIISFAGIIMGIAFGGLLFSDVIVLSECGFMMFIAVLFDTFVVRTIMVPAIMNLAGEWNWWPGNAYDPARNRLKNEFGEYEKTDPVYPY